MILIHFVKNGEKVDEAGVDHFFNVPVMTIQTPKGNNTYRIYTDRTEWLITDMKDEITVHVVSE